MNVHWYIARLMEDSEYSQCNQVPKTAQQASYYYVINYYAIN